MRPIYTQIKFDVENEMVGDVNKLTPYLTISQTPESIVYNKVVPTNSIELFQEYKKPGVMLDLMVNQLGQDIAKKLKPSLKLIQSVDHMYKEKRYELKLNLVLPEEKLLYEAKETMLKEMVEKSNQTIGKLKEDLKVEQQFTQHLEDKCLKLEGRVNMLEKSIWGRFKFLFKGKI